MKHFFNILLFKFQTWLNRLLIKHVDIGDSNEVIKIVTKKIGITWINMENHIEVVNKFIIPYTLEEVKLTYYNDAGQNIGYLHFKEAVYIGPFAKKVVLMPSKMSNITALFNMVRLFVVDDIKTRTVGTTTIKLLGMRFELPIDDIMIVDKEKIVMDEETEEEREKRLAARSLREKGKAKKRIEKKQRQEQKLEMLAKKRTEKKKLLLEKLEARKEKVEKKRLARQRLKRMKLNKEQKMQEIKEPQENIAAPIISSEETELPTLEQEFSTPDQDKLNLDQIT